MKKILGFLMAIAMCISISAPAMATNAEPSELTMEEAIQILGLTEEEAEGMEIHRFSSLSENGNQRGLPTSMTRGVYYEDFTMGSFIGAIHTLNGNKFKWAFKLNEFVDVLPTYLLTAAVTQHYTTSRPSDGCYYFHNTTDSVTTNWKEIDYGQQIYFQYWLNGRDSGDRATARVVVAVY